MRSPIATDEPEEGKDAMQMPGEPHHLKVGILNPPLPLSRDRFVGTPGAQLSSYLWDAVRAADQGWTWQSTQRATRLNRFSFVKWAEGEETWQSAFDSFVNGLRV